MESRLVTSLWNVKGHNSALELKLESSGTHLYVSEDGELTDLRSPLGSPRPHPGLPQLLNVANEHVSLRGGGGLEEARIRGHDPILGDEVHLEEGEDDGPVAP